jgi:3D (Asp-Asp-Asp) domain-containing protein
MNVASRIGAVTVSLRRRRNAVFAASIGTCLTLAVVATVMAGSANSSMLLMSVDRFARAVHETEATPSDFRPEHAQPATSVDPLQHNEADSDWRPATAQHGEDSQVQWLSDEVRYFNGRPIRPVRTMTMIVTAYSPDERSCGKWADGITASGYSVWTNGMKLVAADTRILPFGSLLSIPGYDHENVVPVLDRGGAIKGKRLDVLYPTHERALRWGVQELEVTVWDYADGAPNGFRQNHRRRR